MISRKSTSRRRPMGCEPGSKGSIISHYASFTSLAYAKRIIVETTILLLQNQFSFVASALLCSLYISLETASKPSNPINSIEGYISIVNLTLHLNKKLVDDLEDNPQLRQGDKWPIALSGNCQYKQSRHHDWGGRKRRQNTATVSPYHP